MSRGVDATVEVARRLGVRVDDPVVVRDLGSTVVHLSPSPFLHPGRFVFFFRFISLPFFQK